MNFEASANTALQCGAPQGSVLGLILLKLLTVYTLQLGQLIDRHRIAR